MVQLSEIGNDAWTHFVALANTSVAECKGQRIVRESSSLPSTALTSPRQEFRFDVNSNHGMILLKNNETTRTASSGICGGAGFDNLNLVDAADPVSRQIEDLRRQAAAI